MLAVPELALSEWASRELLEKEKAVGRGEATYLNLYKTMR